MTRLVIGLFLIVMPFLELALLIKTGQLIGVWATVALVVSTAFIGALIISQQSFTVFSQSLEAMSKGRPPVAQVLDGLFLMLAGALLLMPGLITDVFALVLLVPPIRRAVALWSIRRMMRGADVGDEVNGQARAGPQAPHSAGTREGPVIEGEFERLSETSTGPRRGNGQSPP